MKNPLDITDRETLFRLLNSQQKATVFVDEIEMQQEILTRVRGQDHVVEDVVKLVRQQYAKVTRNRPVANILFLGPTGTGKTEMAKAMAGYLYGDESHMLRFDCSEFSGPEGKTRLIGTPTGYVGADKGGQLTRPVLNNPKKLILFDEIEKAFSGVFDLFLSMMGDGRLTEQGSGRVADLTQSIIILTSNAEYEAIAKIQEQVTDAYEQIDAIKKHLRDCKTFRPEILGRFDRIYVFKPLPQEVLAEIAAIKTIALAKQFDLQLDWVDPQLMAEALLASFKVAEFGARELERIVDSMFAEAMIQARQDGVKCIALDRSADGQIVVRASETAALASSAMT
ncbi:MAG: ATP-dependent Clp protease ATP-binding subunit [Planctomycetales bacterium]|nr:ATP-dependent Clp protease ATP-binding subunit [Planctomycetales bacterium]